MERIRTILAATDYSDAARIAELRAAMLSVELKARALEVVTVAAHEADLEKFLQAASEKSQLSKTASIVYSTPSVASGARGGNWPPCTRTIGLGAPARVIARRADELQADVIVVAVKDSELLVGDNEHADGLDLMRATDRPLLLVRSHPRDAYRTALVAVDLTEEAHETAAMCMAVAPNAHHTLFHAARLDGDDDVCADDVDGGESVVRLSTYRASEIAGQRIRQIASSLQAARQVSRVVRFGAPSVAIREFALQLGADLVAIGRKEGAAVGEIARALARDLHCDLLLVPARESGWDGGTAA